MSWQPCADWLHGGQTLHLNQGPIDLLIRCEGSAEAVVQAYTQAQETFATVLTSLVEELPLLRTTLSTESPPCYGAVAQRMMKACQPLMTWKVTPMAAVAGAVADHILDALTCVPGVSKAWVNNGGDIALYMTTGQRFDCGVIGNLQNSHQLGQLSLGPEDGVGGIATSGQAMSGQGGRSFSLGIADSVTVLAHSAAAADVAATLIANRVDLPGHPSVTRIAASQIDPDSDLGEREITQSVGYLRCTEIKQALQCGATRATEFIELGHIHCALLNLRGQQRAVQHSHLLGEIA